jgi:hypothetical protein
VPLIGDASDRPRISIDLIWIDQENSRFVGHDLIPSDVKPSPAIEMGRQAFSIPVSVRGISNCFVEVYGHPQVPPEADTSRLRRALAWCRNVRNPDRSGAAACDTHRTTASSYPPSAPSQASWSTHSMLDGKG